MSNSCCSIHTKYPFLKLLKMQPSDLKEQVEWLLFKKYVFSVPTFTRLNMQITQYVNLYMASVFQDWLIQRY